MKTTYLDKDAGIQEWRRLTGHEGTVQEDVLRANISDAVSQMLTDEQFGYNIALFDIRSRKTLLPPNFETLVLIAAVKSDEHRVNRGHMINWVYGVAGSDCELHIDLKCPDCDPQPCSCSAPIIIETDKLFREEHPEMEVNKWRHFAGFSRPTTDGFPVSNIFPQFRLLTPFTNNSAFWNTNHYIGDCPNLGCLSTDGYRFEIENGYLITDFDCGQVLLSYLGSYKDADGYYLIPDTPQAVAGCVWYAQARELYRRYLIALDPAVERAWQAATSLAELHIGRARDELAVPSAEDWTTIFKEIWAIPDHKYYYHNPYNR